MMKLSTHRRGVTLVELLLFLAIAAIMGVAMMPLMFSSTENRVLQESIAHVENNGSQLMQVIGAAVRDAEKILDPLPRETGPVLALQMSSGSLTPTIFGTLTGSVLRVQKITHEIISANEVAVENFRVRNVSNGYSTGVTISFKLSRTLRLEAPRIYSQQFQSTFNMFTKNTLRGDSCGLALPGCTGGDHYSWQVCDPLAENATRQLDC